MNKNELLTQLKEIKAEMINKDGYLKVFTVGASDFQYIDGANGDLYLDFIDEIKESDIKEVFVYENKYIYRAYIEIEA